MGSNILSIGSSALNAAQIGLSTTGHNIANASTPGYSRQVMIQSSAQAQSFGSSFIGQGTQVAGIERVYNDVIAKQLVTTQANSSAYDTYYSQISTIDNMLSDPSAGLAPAMSDFFSSLKSLAANPNDVPSRQVMLSSANALASRFSSLDSRLKEINEGVNSQISTTVGLVNSYAQQIGSLNGIIEKAISTTGNTPNDLMDQRDQLVLELSKQVKTTVVKEGNSGYNVFVGSGLPLVVGDNTYKFVATTSPTDPTRLEVAYQTSNKQTILGASSLNGGALGGLIQFRSESLDPVRNQLGQIAIALTGSFNDQQAQGLDMNGKPGVALFKLPTPDVTNNYNNTGTAIFAADIVEPSAVVNSDYKVSYDQTANQYTVTRLADKREQSFTSLPITVDGLSIKQTSGSIADGDSFTVSATKNAAGNISVATNDVNKLALGSLVLSSSANTANTGSGSISGLKVDNTYSANPLTSGLSLTYNSGVPNTLSMVPASTAVTVTYGGVSTTFPAGSPITYTNGATISIGSLSFSLSGSPSNGDQFSITPNTSSGASDNSNGLLLSGLENTNLVARMTQDSSATTIDTTEKSSYFTAFSQMVSGVGSKANELKVTSTAEQKALEQVNTAMQSESGVNLDEEAANLLRYQQAYQAAGKVMQIASDLFDVLLNIG
ncbi:MAG: flagellar hook-associated protein FlgK [Methylophilus sp.]|jgi:flagellar hook-associated protein 1 FlgK